jgi:methylenetetrahydrofolate reductase (NADPH)
MSQDRRYSFEFFPTKTDAGHEKLMATARQLATNPFFSCTYGAGGSTRDRTLNTVLQLESEVKVPAAPHLSCVGDSRTTCAACGQYKAAGIKRIVALRGDLPSGMGMASGELRHANDLVNSSVKKPAITSTSKWRLTRRCTRRRATSKTICQLRAQGQRRRRQRDHPVLLQRRQLLLLRRARTGLGVNIPIVPGIMPITNYSKLARFSDACGAGNPALDPQATGSLWR